jgi:hypothetical protein
VSVGSTRASVGATGEGVGCETGAGERSDAGASVRVGAFVVGGGVVVTGASVTGAAVTGDTVGTSISGLVFSELF